jgi:hypothetical protein
LFDRSAQLRFARGLQVDSSHGDFTVHPKAITATELASTFDVTRQIKQSFN